LERWNGKPLTRGYLVSADEKTRTQARRRLHPMQPLRAARVVEVEHEFQCCGAWAYLAAWDVRRAQIFGRCEPGIGIKPLERLGRT
jgi:hypothetical protein